MSYRPSSSVLVTPIVVVAPSVLCPSCVCAVSPHEQLVHTAVGSEFGMERGHEHRAVATQHRDDPPASEGPVDRTIAVSGAGRERSEDLHPRSHRLDPRCPDEHGVQRSTSQRGDIQLALERLELASEAVASHGEIDRSEVALIGAPVDGVGPEQDHPGARPERRQSCGELFAQGVGES
jgi:hypothetical protein